MVLGQSVYQPLDLGGVGSIVAEKGKEILQVF